ncbi:AMP-binding protein [Tsukamurella soli]|uniref:AMP-binding protein n=1 Tax=Tsukamurella soli TaxID=644556 RepID=A0ABP8KES4_9ACTN
MTRAQQLDDAARHVRALQEKCRPAAVPGTVDHPVAGGVVDHLRHWAAERPRTVAIAFYGRDVTFAELDELSDRFAGWLLGVGVRHGDRIGVHLGNCPQFHVAMLGVLKAGCVHVPINPLFREHELRHELTDAGVSVLLTQDTFADLVATVVPDTGVRRVAYTALSDMLDTEPVVPVPFPISGAETDWAGIVASEPAAAVPTDVDALAALNYTGGTTGMPKGCEHTQRHMVYTAATALAGAGRKVAQGDSVTLNFLPVFWIAGEDFGILLPLVGGGPVVLMTRWDPEAALALIERYGVTDMVGTVDNYVELMDLPGFDGARAATVRNALAVSFVLKLTPEIRARWRATTGGVLREASYGMTETHTADTTTLGFQDGDADLATDPVFCGHPVPGTDILIVDDSGAPVPVGTSGEIIVRSPSLLTRYHNRPDATAEALRDGWLHTGDVGRLDEWGALHYLARTKEMIKTNGMSVFPSEVEALLRMHPDIVAVAVVPRPDPTRGQRPYAFVALSPGSAADAAAVTEWARANMAGYKVPDIEVVDELPMTATGKIRKGELLDRAAVRAENGDPW